MNRQEGDNRRVKTREELEELVARLTVKNNNRRKALRAMNKSLLARYHVAQAQGAGISTLHRSLNERDAEIAHLERKVVALGGSI